MEKRSLSFSFLEYESIAELAAGDQDLLERAGIAAGSAYAPYSHYAVGAAIRMDNGEIYVGNNQENMAFPSGLCAERVALYSAVSCNPGIPVQTIAITAKSEQFLIDQPVPPCGSCRQAFIEYELRDRQKIRIILKGETGKILIVNGMESLLPLTFREDRLNK
jgi:cytidine deaminase